MSGVFLEGLDWFDTNRTNVSLDIGARNHEFVWFVPNHAHLSWNTPGCQNAPRPFVWFVSPVRAVRVYIFTAYASNVSPRPSKRLAASRI
jgi:hypothetical protein